MPVSGPLQNLNSVFVRNPNKGEVRTVWKELWRMNLTLNLRFSLCSGFLFRRIFQGENASTVKEEMHKQKKKIYHNCKAKGGKEKGLKENACQCWQQRVCVLEDKPTKNTAGNKKNR